MFFDIQIIDRYLTDNWNGYWNLFVGNNLRDDPLLCLAMTINEMYCAEDPAIGKFIAVPSGYTYKKIDLLTGKLDVIDKSGNLYVDCPILHFSSRRVREEWLYPWQVRVLDAYVNKESSFCIKLAESNFCALFFKAECFVRKVFRKIKSFLK